MMNITLMDKVILRRKMPLILMLILLMICNAGSAQNIFAESGNITLATVNGDSINTIDVEQELLKLHKNMTSREKSEFDYKNILNQLVNNTLILQESYAMELNDNQAIKNILEKDQISYIRERFIKDNFKPEIEIEESSIIDYYNKYYNRMQIRTLAASTLDSAHLFIKLIEDGASMDSLARAYSLDSKRNVGGLHNLSFYADIEVPFREVAQVLEINEISKPVPYNEAYIIIRLEGKQEADLSAIDHLRRKIISELRYEEQNILWKAFIDSLKSEFGLTINQANLVKIKNDSTILFSPDFVIDDGSPVIEINESYFTSATDFRRELSYTAMSNAQAPFDTLVDMSIRSKSKDLVLDYGASLQDYNDDAKTIERYQSKYDSMLIELYLNEFIVSQIKFNRKEFSKYYEENKDKFKAPEEFQLLRYKTNSIDSAMQLYSRVKEGANFEFVLKQYDPNNISENDKNEWISPDITPNSIGSKIRELSIGDCSQPMRTQDGLIVYYVYNKREGRQKSIEEVDLEIRKVMFQRKFNELLDKNLSRLKELSDIVYYDDKIDNYFSR